MPLEEILGGRRTAAQLRDTDKDPLPAIFRAAPFPLLLTVPVTLDNSWYVHELGLLTLSSDGRLLRWNVQTQGAEQLAMGLQPGRIFGATNPTNENDQTCLILGRPSTYQLHALLLGRDGKVNLVEPLRPGGIGTAVVLVDQAVAYIATIQRVVAVDLTSRSFPVISANSVLSPVDVRSGTMFKTVAQYDGSSAWQRPVLRDERVEYTLVCRKDLLRMFDVRGIEGPVGITPRGDIFFAGKDETKNVNHGLPLPVRCVAVSRDGLRFVLRNGGECMLVHTLNGAARKCSDVARDLEPYLQLLAKPRTLRRRFQGIGVDAGGQLALIMRKRTSWLLQSPKLAFPVGAQRVDFKWQPFSDWEHAEVAGFHLRRAEFPDGSVAVLDSSGLLHLRSADANILECTIVLCEGPTAGWCADGRVWGPKYFLGSRGRTGATANSIAEEVIRPFLERLR